VKDAVNGGSDKLAAALPKADDAKKKVAIAPALTSIVKELSLDWVRKSKRPIDRSIECKNG
jgi:hypothetical protein